jgi:hypothetical protein
MSDDAIVLRATLPVLPLGLRRDWWLVIRPGADSPVRGVFDVTAPNYAMILQLLDQGVLVDEYGGAREALSVAG